jgi:hypothetical protein
MVIIAVVVGIVLDSASGRVSIREFQSSVILK